MTGIWVVYACLVLVIEWDYPAKLERHTDSIALINRVHAPRGTLAPWKCTLQMAGNSLNNVTATLTRAWEKIGRLPDRQSNPIWPNYGTLCGPAAKLAREIDYVRCTTKRTCAHFHHGSTPVDGQEIGHNNVDSTLTEGFGNTNDWKIDNCWTYRVIHSIWPNYFTYDLGQEELEAL